MERLNSLPDVKHPVTVYKEGEIAKLKFGLPPEDQEIATRLENLRKDESSGQETAVSEDDIKARLDKLRGVDESTKSTMPKISAPQPNAVQADTLMQQMSDEVALDKSMPNPDEEIEERLAKLKGVEVDQVRCPGKGLLSSKKSIPDHSDYTNPDDVEFDVFMAQEVSQFFVHYSRSREARARFL